MDRSKEECPRRQYSTSIAGTTTMCCGELDDNGFWEFDCEDCPFTLTEILEMKTSGTHS